MIRTNRYREVKKGKKERKKKVPYCFTTYAWETSSTQSCYAQNLICFTIL